MDYDKTQFINRELKLKSYFKETNNFVRFCVRNVFTTTTKKGVKSQNQKKKKNDE